MATRFPTLLGIGAQRAGTTWLASQLAKHPDVFVPPAKEIHFFDRPDNLTKNHAFRRRLLESMETVVGTEKAPADWAKRFLVQEEQLDWDWYGSLYDDCSQDVLADITPAYMKLSPDVVSLIRARLPEARIIFIMRNPVDRAWSFLERWVEMQSSIRRVTDDDVERLIHTDAVVSDYAHAFTTWLSLFPRHQVFVAFFEEMIATPHDYIRRVCDFLRIDASLIEDKVSRQKVNSSTTRTIPPRFAEILAHTHRDIVRDVEEYVGYLPDQWRR